jgi:hypothetical protein
MLRRTLIGLGLGLGVALVLAGCASSDPGQDAAKAAKASAIATARAQITAAVQKQNRQIRMGDADITFATDDLSRGTAAISRGYRENPGWADFQYRPDGMWAVGCADTATNQVVDFTEDPRMSANWNASAGLCPPGYQKGMVPDAPASTTSSGRPHS